ncbi:hypothetical protein SOCE26_064050 [Sorangium cellulosum]|uniref:Uncharacterized protein n=1 Tax=Sorangium cellulosum TaxID=56 RepID=A0A2L0F068_SORCE|nr:hypothetical protein [Sorangium cellulosum]AUX44935.1 hypothetical protein SOCE26_064050 [Sorangium cellulosum]
MTGAGDSGGDPSAGESLPPAGDGEAVGAPGAELRTTAANGATLWLTQSPGFSLWRGEIPAPDRLRIEGRDGYLHELRLEPVGVLRLGRAERVGDERNELVVPDAASRLAATLRHDGVRWWLRRREECSVPVQVGARHLARGEESPLVHGAFVCVGGMRATFFDRRYAALSVPAGTVDPATGLLARAGLEHECAALLSRGRAGSLVLVRPIEAAAPPPGAASRAAEAAPPPPGAASRAAAALVALHRLWPDLPVGDADGAAAALVRGGPEEASAAARRAAEAAEAAGIGPFACGYFTLAGDADAAGREVELAVHAITSLAAERARGAPVPSGAAELRDAAASARLASPSEVLGASQSGRRATVLFGIEEQSALGAVGPHVIGALAQELAAVVASHAGSGALIAPLAPGVVAACVPRKADPAAMASAVQCDWHARPPILDGKVEHARPLSWELLHEADAGARAAEISRECSDPHGVLSALSGGLPYPIAGRVRAAIGASSAIERVKMLFDVLEGTWRFIATVLVSAYFSGGSAGAGAGRGAGSGGSAGASGAGDAAGAGGGRGSVGPASGGRESSPSGSGGSGAGGGVPQGWGALLDFYGRTRTRDGLALGAWRELARTAARAFGDRDDPIGSMAREVLDVKLSHNQTFETLSNLMQAERNQFAHGHYTEARAAADLPDFEQMTRALLRAQRPLCAWTLVTVEKTEPDLYGDLQTVEFIDHTGPFASGTRRRIGLNSPVRLSNVVYLARFREGLMLPLDPMVKRLPHEDRFDLYWMDHLPRQGLCQLSAVVAGRAVKAPYDARRMPPLLRTLIEAAGG